MMSTKMLYGKVQGYAKKTAVAEIETLNGEIYRDLKKHFSTFSKKLLISRFLRPKFSLVKCLKKSSL